MGFWGVTLGFYSQCVAEHVRDVQPSFRSTLNTQNVPNLLEIFSSCRSADSSFFYSGKEDYFNGSLVPPGDDAP